MAILKEAPAPVEVTVAPDILRLGGTLIRFPVIGDSSIIALKEIAMNRGTVILSYPEYEGMRKSYRIETYGETPALPARTKVDLRLNSVTIARNDIVGEAPYIMYYKEKAAATIRRDGVMVVNVKDRTIPLDILIGKSDTLIADISTKRYSHRIVMRDFSLQKWDGIQPNASVQFIGSREEHLVNEVQRTWQMEFAGKTILSVHFLT